MFDGRLKGHVDSTDCSWAIESEGRFKARVISITVAKVATLKRAEEAAEEAKRNAEELAKAKELGLPRPPVVEAPPVYEHWDTLFEGDECRLDGVLLGGGSSVATSDCGDSVADTLTDTESDSGHSGIRLVWGGQRQGEIGINVFPLLLMPSTRLRTLTSVLAVAVD